jgi:hypothetical protein
MRKEQLYTAKLQSGLGMIEETRILLELWEPGMNKTELYQRALDLGCFANMSARRLYNLIVEGFASRYLIEDGYPAILLKLFDPYLSVNEINQLLFLFTCRANLILSDFVREVYWKCYSNGDESISNEIARDFVVVANQQRKTVKPWSENTVRRQATYLTRCCADFGLLEPGPRSIRRILPYRIEPIVVVILAYDLHFSGFGDNALVFHPDWQLFGMDKQDVINELKRVSMSNFLIIQSAVDITRISFKYKDWEGVTGAIAQG